MRAADGAPVFVRRSIDAVGLAPAVDQEELAGLEMLFRDAVELAVGHGVAVEATYAADAPDRGVRIATAAMPRQDVPRTDAPGPEDFADAPEIAEPFARAAAALDMQRLAEAEPRRAAGAAGAARRRLRGLDRPPGAPARRPATRA